MALEDRLHRPVSNRGQWRGSYLVVAPGTPLPDSATITVFSSDDRCGASDYGIRRYGRNREWSPLSAALDDGTGRFTVAPVDKGLAFAWLFPADAMRSLCAGSYEASLSVMIGDEDAELARLKFVVR